MTFPIGLDLNARRCLVVGTSSEAAERVTALAAQGALVRWVLPSGDHAALSLAAEARSERIYGSLAYEHLDGVWLVVQADRDAQLATTLQAWCQARQLWFCAIDQPEFCSFSHLAQVKLDPVLIAISSGGKAPALSRRLRQELQRLFEHDAVRGFFAHIAALRQNTPASERRKVLGDALEGFAINGQVQLPASFTQK